jgi:hypothetical protein
LTRCRSVVIAANLRVSAAACHQDERGEAADLAARVTEEGTRELRAHLGVAI